MTRAEIAILETDLLQLSASVRVHQIERSAVSAEAVDVTDAADALALEADSAASEGSQPAGDTPSE